MSKELKKKIRKEILARRRGLSEQDVAEMSARVRENLKRSGLLDGRKKVALYASADGEVSTRELFRELREKGVETLFPRVRGKGPHIDFYPVTDWVSMGESEMGIPEPEPEGEPVPPEEFDFVLVPGVAFDRHGGRVGYGMGCYDRVLERLREGVPMVGVGYDFQIYEEVPMEAHDVPLSAIVSESEIASSENGDG